MKYVVLSGGFMDLYSSDINVSLAFFIPLPFPLDTFNQFQILARCQTDSTENWGPLLICVAATTQLATTVQMFPRVWNSPDMNSTPPLISRGLCMFTFAFSVVQPLTSKIISAR